ncbi:hypothetical protein EN834_35440, partial [bacterium M00.F.Ca.ET.191.01.1.1]
MSARPLFPPLHALIGEAADLLPADLAERIETLLDDPKDLLPALLARMRILLTVVLPEPLSP